MLLSLLFSDVDFGMKLLLILVSIIAMLPALTLHEFAHGYVAYKLGDKTAKADGRLSLNPLDHIDPIGSLMLLFVGFGWAKPVPVVTRNFKKPRRDFALVSLAGPITNFIAAFISALLYALTAVICLKYNFDSNVAYAIQMIFYYSVSLNLGLALFNLIPLPPLDGSNVVMCLLPNRLAARYSRIRFYTQYIFIGLIILRRIPVLDIIPEIVFWPIEKGVFYISYFFIEQVGVSIFGNLL